MSKINLDRFIEVYVSVALDLIEKEREMPFSKFEKIVRGRVSRRMWISRKKIAYLHHPFHRAFFERGEESPLKYIQPRMAGEVSRVRLNGKQLDKSILMDYIKENYKEPYLRARAENF